MVFKFFISTYVKYSHKRLLFANVALLICCIPSRSSSIKSYKKQSIPLRCKSFYNIYLHIPINKYQCCSNQGNMRKHFILKNVNTLFCCSSSYNLLFNLFRFIVAITISINILKIRLHIFTFFLVYLLVKFK